MEKTLTLSRAMMALMSESSAAVGYLGEACGGARIQRGTGQWRHWTATGHDGDAK